MDSTKANAPRVAVLIGADTPCRQTLATLLNDNINVVCAVEANEKSMGINFTYLKKAIKKQGPLTVISQILERIRYLIFDKKRDQKVYHSLYSEAQINQTIASMKSPLYQCENYSSPEVIDHIQSAKPDLIVIHTPYWVGKKIRDITKGKVIGGHPGITQRYRGAHSAFWAMANNDFQNIGYTVFWVDKGVDTGDILAQGKITPTNEDSYITLNWRGMKAIAGEISELIRSQKFESTKNESVNDKTLYFHPELGKYFKYRKNLHNFLKS